MEGLTHPPSGPFRPANFLGDEQLAENSPALLAVKSRYDNRGCPLSRLSISSRSEAHATFLDREDTMDDTISTIYYCLCEEFLKATGHRDEPQRGSGSNTE